MAFAETANLAVKLTLGGNFTSQMSKARASLRGFDKESRAFRAGAQIGTGIKRSAILAIAGITAMAGALAVAVKEGQEAAKVQEIFANAISNSRKVTAANVTALNAQQKALMNLAGVDDELIKTEQTRLIQMGLTGDQVQRLTPLILDVAKATGKDLLTVTLAVGKAANGNTTALQRLGIVLPKVGKATKSAALATLEHQKLQLAASEAAAKARGPLSKSEKAYWAHRKAVLASAIATQKLTDANKKGGKEASSFDTTVAALSARFGGAAAATSGDFSTRLLALQENLKNIREDVGIKLLPALTRIVGVVGTQLVPAFGKFVDRILPSLNDGLNQFADALANGGAENAIRGITDALGPMVELVKIAAAPVKAIVQAFLSLPKEVQTVLVGAFAVNKLTGGLVTNAAGGLVEALGKAVLGGIKAPLVNVQGGVVNVGGGIPGGGGGAATALKGGELLASLGLTTATLLPLTVGLIAAAGLGVVLDNAITNAGGLPKAGKQLQDSGLTLGPNPVQKDPGGRGTAFLGGKGTSLTVVGSNPTINLQHGVNVPMAPNTGRHTGEKATGISSLISAAQIVVAPMSKSAAKAAASAALAAAAARSAASASMRKDAAPSVSTSVNVNVAVTAGGVKKVVTVHERYGPPAGSRTDNRFLGFERV